MLTRWFERLGYVSREQLETTTSALQQMHAQLASELEQAQAQLEKSRTALDHARSETADWKASATEGARRITALERELKRVRKFERLWEREQQREEQRDLEHARALDDLRTRLETALQELAGAREHLALVEVKLDIVEGAANVLDSRLRAVLPRRNGDDSSS